mmetsp:Transcript_23057/g.58515  ORF Transcript_23057/g.58515 Transcript_23057/m.58515 type:complete len:215 (+) Transcript_23057:902-1546(+)
MMPTVASSDSAAGRNTEAGLSVAGTVASWASAAGSAGRSGCTPVTAATHATTGVANSSQSEGSMRECGWLERTTSAGGARTLASASTRLASACARHAGCGLAGSRAFPAAALSAGAGHATALSTLRWALALRRTSLVASCSIGAGVAVFCVESAGGCGVSPPSSTLSPLPPCSGVTVSSGSGGRALALRRICSSTPCTGGVSISASSSGSGDSG